MKEIKDKETRDAAMIAAAQAVEHYEIARYGALVSWANLLDMADAGNLLEETLGDVLEPRRIRALISRRDELLASP